MKRLDRGKAPACLAGFRTGRDTWKDLTPDDRQEIRSALDAMQRRLCAYCEGSLDALGEHIEHLRGRAAYPQRTFDWHNLFSSCDRHDSCGRFKDHVAGAYDANDLVDPAIEDPDDVFVFRSTGRVDVRAGLDPSRHGRAAETIRVLNLNLDAPRGGRSLCAERRRVLATYQSQSPDILTALESCDEAERQEFIALELSATRWTPFSSVIRHFFSRAA